MAESRKKLAIIDGKSVFYPDTKSLKLHNLITDYSAQVLVRGRQGLFFKGIGIHG